MTTNERNPVRTWHARHRGRGSQVLIYLGKQLRFFINENDWKVLPMAAIIAALVTMVIRKRLFQNMEGDLLGSFAIVCVAIWNGCFNSIQSVCRERPIIKREHRAGLHISAYVAAHMIYQFFLCFLQTAITLVVMYALGDFKDPTNPNLVSLQRILIGKGFMTPWMGLDLGISLLLISYASDMMSLFISSVSHTTTGAMTVMPFVLIFQLIFSGGIIPLPAWSKPLSNFTISTYGIKAITCQTDYNNAPMVTGWNTLDGMRDKEIAGRVTLGQVMDLLETRPVRAHSDAVIIPPIKVSDLVTDMVSLVDPEGVLTGEETEPAGTAEAEMMTDPITLGEISEFIRESQILQKRRDLGLDYNTTVGEIIEMIGADRVKEIVLTTTAKANYKAEYARTVPNIVRNWLMLAAFIFIFAALATISLELIDRDKR